MLKPPPHQCEASTAGAKTNDKLLRLQKKKKSEIKKWGGGGEGERGGGGGGRETVNNFFFLLLKCKRMLIKHTLMRLGQRQLFSTFSSKHQLPLAVHRPPLGRRNGGERHTNAHCVRGIGSRWHLSKNPKIWWQPLIISSLTLPFKCT